jgi:Zn-dependent protease
MKNMSLVITLAIKSAKLLKLFKSAKILKVGISFMSMAIFAVCHSAVMGIAFGISLVVLLFIHELGHIIALKQKGYETKLPYFIPFVGAVISAPKFDDRHTEAYVGYGGPLVGTLAAIAAAAPFFVTGDKFWITVSFIGIALNLFNMVPISPLDGGRITQAIHSKFKYLGFLLLLAFTVMLGEPGMLIIWIAVIFDFNTMRMKKRLKLAIGVWVLMATLTFAGVGENYWANVVDVMFGLVLALPAFFFFIGENSEQREAELAKLEESHKDVRPECFQKYRLGWLIAWIVLIWVQIVIMILQVPFLRTK